MNNPRFVTIQQFIERVETNIEASLKTCLNCEFFEERTELCHNQTNCPQYPARPPARIIAFGCDRYLDKPPF